MFLRPHRFKGYTLLPKDIPKAHTVINSLGTKQRRKARGTIFTQTSSFYTEVSSAQLGVSITPAFLFVANMGHTTGNQIFPEPKCNREDKVQETSILFNEKAFSNLTKQYSMITWYSSLWSKFIPNQFPLFTGRFSLSLRFVSIVISYVCWASQSDTEFIALLSSSFRASQLQQTNFLKVIFFFFAERMMLTSC